MLVRNIVHSQLSGNSYNLTAVDKKCIHLQWSIDLSSDRVFCIHYVQCLIPKNFINVIKRYATTLIILTKKLEVL